MAAWYNEPDAKKAAWLRELMKAGAIADGVVDERGIQDVRPDDLRDFAQCHFFAGIGVWSYALRLAGWPDDEPIWTGSCPCQPFSSAGRQRGLDDERHLWPVWFDLIRERAPAVVLGEQVASKDALAWWDLVSADLEDAGYAAGVADLCAPGVGAPHIRQRLYWMAYADDAFGRAGAAGRHDRLGHDAGWPQGAGDTQGRGGAGGLVDSLGARLERQRGHGDDGHQPRRLDAIKDGSATAAGGAGGLGDASEGPGERHARALSRAEAGVDGARLGVDGRDALRLEHAGAGLRGLADADGGHAGAEWQQRSGEQRQQQEDGRVGAGTGPTDGHWRAADWLLCTDGKWRPVEPGSFPLAHGAPARVGRLRGYGDAIVAPLAAAFVEAAREAILDHQWARDAA